MIGAAAWPTGADLTEWVGSTTAEAADPFVDGVMASAINWFVRRVYSERMPPGFDPSAPDLGGETCPPEVFDALVMEGARLLTRRHSANGAIASAELLMRVSASDPDIKAMLHEYVYQPMA